MFDFLKAPRAVAGILSFLLPGLGHLFGGNVGLALAWFLPFFGVLLTDLPRGILLVLAVVSSWDAYRRGFAEGSASRRFLFASAGICAFLFWSVSLSPLLRPIEGQLRVERAAKKVAERVRRCRRSLGRYPDSARDCAALGSATDPWGNPFRYDRVTRGKGGFALSSPGPDRRWGGGDDFIFRFR